MISTTDDIRLPAHTVASARFKPRHEQRIDNERPIHPFYLWTFVYHSDNLQAITNTTADTSDRIHDIGIIGHSDFFMAMTKTSISTP
jgi:hypothetical protein